MSFFGHPSSWSHTCLAQTLFECLQSCWAPWATESTWASSLSTARCVQVVSDLLFESVWLTLLAGSPSLFGACNFFEAENSVCQLTSSAALCWRSLLGARNCQKSKSAGQKHLPMNASLWKQSTGNSDLGFHETENLMHPDYAAFEIESFKSWFFCLFFFSWSDRKCPCQKLATQLTLWH